MEGESDVTPSIIVELHSLEIQEDQTASETGVTRSIIHALHSWIIQTDQM